MDTFYNFFRCFIAKKKQEEYNKKVSAGKVGRRSLISGQSGGIGYYKDPM